MKLTPSLPPGALSRRAISALALLTIVNCSGADDGEPAMPGSTAGAGGALAGAGGSASGGGSGGALSAGTSGSTPVGGTGGVAQAGAGGVAQAGAGGVAQAGAGGATLSPGETLYVLNCAMCHGAQGAGAMFGPELQHPVRDYSTWVVRNGRATTTYAMPMEKFGTDKLSDADLTLIWDYLDKPPQPTTGQALYLDYCGNCHGADGSGGPTMRPITNELDKLKMQVRNGTHPGEFDMRREYMPALNTTRISDAELQLIYDYVDSL